MGEYYANYHQLEEAGEMTGRYAAGMEEGAPTLEASARVIARSQTLEHLGYASLTQRAGASTKRVASDVARVSKVMAEISALCSDYEAQVIAVLDEEVMGGNGFSAASRADVREKTEHVVRASLVDKGLRASMDVLGGRKASSNEPIPQTLSDAEKREWTLSWLRENRPDLLEQIYDRLQAGGVAAGAISAGGMATQGAGSSGGAGAAAGVPYSGVPTSWSETSQPAVPSDVGGDATSAYGFGSTGDASGGVLSADIAGAAGAGSASASGGSEPGASFLPEQGGAGVSTSDGIGAPASAAGVGGAATGADVGGVATGADVGNMASGAESDWVADLLNEAVDEELLQRAKSAVDGAAAAQNAAAVRTGVAAFFGNGDLILMDGETSIFAHFGEGVVEIVGRYGMQAGLLAGGTGTAVAASGPAIEAVAHCAEFMSTKAIPYVTEALGKVAEFARVTQAGIGSIVGGIVAPGTGAGGLLG